MHRNFIKKIASNKNISQSVFKNLSLQNTLKACFINCQKPQINNFQFNFLKQYQFSTSDNPAAIINELKEIEQQFINIYNTDILMEKHEEGFQLLEQIISKKQQIYKTEQYQGWVDDIIIKIQYLYHKQQSPDAEKLTNEILEKLGEEESNENLILQAKVCERVSLKIATFIGLEDGIEKLNQGIDFYSKVEGGEQSEYMAKLNKILASLYENNQEYEKAFQTYEKCGNIYNSLIRSGKNEQQQTYFGKQQSLCYQQFAKLCRSLQFYKEAETLLTASFNIWNTIEGEDKMESMEFIQISKELGELGLESGNYENAFRFLSQCEKALKFVSEENATIVSSVYSNLGRFNYLVQNYPKAADYTAKAEQIMERYPLSYEQQCQIIEQKVTIQYMLQEKDLALKTVDQGLRLCSRYNTEDYFYLKYLYFQGLLFQAKNQFTQAQESGEKLLKSAIQQFGDDSEHAADGHRIIGHALISQSQDKIDEVLDQIQKAANIYGVLGQKITDYMYCLEDIIRYGQAFDRLQKARDACVELKVIRKEIMGNLGVEQEKIDKEIEIIDKKIAEIDVKVQMEKNKQAELAAEKEKKE